MSAFPFQALAFICFCTQGKTRAILLVPSCCCLVTQSCPTLCNPRDDSPPGSSVHGISQSIGADCYSLLQGILPTQGSNLHLLHWQVDSLPVSEPPGKSRMFSQLWIWGSWLIHGGHRMPGASERKSRLLRTPEDDAHLPGEDSMDSSSWLP